MPTSEEIFLQGFNGVQEPEMPVVEKLAKNLGLDEEPEMPILAKLAGNLGLLEEEEAPEMPIVEKLAANLGINEEGAGSEEELDLSGMTDLEKLAFMKWAAKNGLTSKLKGGVETLMGKGVEKAKAKAEKAKAEKPKTGRLFLPGKKAKSVAAAEKGVSEAKAKRLKTGLKAGAGAGAALLTAAAIKKAIGGRDKKKGKAA